MTSGLFWVLAILAIVVGGFVIYISIDEKNSTFLALYCLGFLFGVIIFGSTIPSSESLAEKYNVDYATAEAIHAVTDIPESTVIEMIYYLELDDADLQSGFNLSDEEMTAIRILIEKKK